MQKVLNFLEQHVQWFALGLGAIFLLWTTYAYVLTPPAVVKLPNRPEVRPGDLAEITADGPVKEIHSQINSSVAPPEFAVADVTTPFKQAMGAPSAPPFPPYAMNSPVESGTVLRPKGQATGPGQLAQLPQLPKAVPLPPQAGLSVVIPPAMAGRNIAQPVESKERDLDWVTLAFVIPADDLKKAFAAPLNGKPIDAQLYQTALLQVVLQRQKATGWDDVGQPVFPGGDKGVEDVTPLSIYQADLLPLPAETASNDAKYQYLQFAQEKGTTLLAHPPFYQVLDGTQWQQPTDTTSGAPGAAPTTGAPGTTTPAPPLRSPTGRANVALPPGERSVMLASADEYDAIRAARDARARAAQQPIFNNGNPNDPAHIDPQNISQNLLVWGHDENVTPGAVYRYRVVYKLKNPIFGFNGMAAPNLVNQFALVSPPSEWGPPITVPEKTKFWIVTLGADRAQLDIFQWSGGKWKQQRAALAPGDVVPGTDWTLFDIRGTGASRPRDKYILLADNVGDISKRDLATDQGDSKHNDLRDLVNNPVRPEDRGRRGRQRRPAGYDQAPLRGG